jgi:hypothetical protein
MPRTLSTTINNELPAKLTLLLDYIIPSSRSRHNLVHADLVIDLARDIL